MTHKEDDEMQKTTLKIINPLIFLLMINQVVTAFLRDVR